MTIEELRRSYQQIMDQFYTEERIAEGMDYMYMDAWLVDEAVIENLCKAVKLAKRQSAYQLRGTEIRFEQIKGIQLLLFGGRVIKDFQSSTEDCIDELLVL